MLTRRQLLLAPLAGPHHAGLSLDERRELDEAVLSLELARENTPHPEWLRRAKSANRIGRLLRRALSSC